MIDPYELQENTPEEKQHFENAKEDSASSLKGRSFEAWTGRMYTCLGHFPCGYHMKPIDGTGRWHCISERAIGRSYHEERAWNRRG